MQHYIIIESINGILHTTECLTEELARSMVGEHPYVLVKVTGENLRVDLEPNNEM